MDVVGHDDESVAIGFVLFEAGLESFHHDVSSLIGTEESTVLIGREGEEMETSGLMEDYSFLHRYLWWGSLD